LGSSADPFYEGQQDSRPIDIAWDRILGGFETQPTQDTLANLFQSTDYLESRQFSMIHKIVLGVLNLDLGLTLEGSTSDIDRTDSSKRSPLSWAALRADTEAARTLLRYNANINSRDVSGKTALHYARNAAVTKLLLAANASVDIRDVYGRTALHAACRRGPDIRRVKLLAEAGADVGAADNWYRTPLSYAAQFNYRDVAVFLLCEKANLESPDIDGFTPLLTAVESNAHELIELLLSEGANYSDLTKNSENIVQIASRSADTKTLKLLAHVKQAKYLGSPSPS
jgi:ankyrin repeat protein